MKRAQTRFEHLLDCWPYLLGAVPLVADWAGHGAQAPSARGLAADLVSGVLVVVLVAAILRKERLLEESSVTDRLTGLYNSRYLRVELDRHLAFAHRQRSPLCVIFLDLDNFKAVNDRRGHDVGNEMLRQFTARMCEAVRRDVDMCFRFGGDEFLILCPQTELAEARAVAERVHAVPAGLAECVREGVTVSAGVVQLRPGESVAALLHRADEGMYAAKRAGKDRVAAGGR